MKNYELKMWIVLIIAYFCAGAFFGFLIGQQNGASNHYEKLIDQAENCYKIPSTHTKEFKIEGQELIVTTTYDKIFVFNLEDIECEDEK